jgi:hypothetical protein
MIIYTFHQIYSLHFTSLPFNSIQFTSLHIISLHCTSLHFIFHFPPVLIVSSSRFKSSSLLLSFNYFPNPLSKNMRFTGNVTSASEVSWFDNFNVLFTNEYLPISVLVSWPNYYDGDNPCSGSVFLVICPL